MKLHSSIRRRINNVICPMGGKFHDCIPLATIDQVCRTEGFMLADETGEPFRGIICGEDGRAKFDLASVAGGLSAVVDNAVLVLEWHKFHSGRFEINTYVS